MMYERVDPQRKTIKMEKRRRRQQKKNNEEEEIEKYKHIVFGFTYATMLCWSNGLRFVGNAKYNIYGETHHCETICAATKGRGKIYVCSTYVNDEYGCPIHITHMRTDGWAENKPNITHNTHTHTRGHTHRYISHASLVSLGISSKKSNVCCACHQTEVEAINTHIAFIFCLANMDLAGYITCKWCATHIHIHFNAHFQSKTIPHLTCNPSMIMILI